MEKIKKEFMKFIDKKTIETIQTANTNKCTMCMEQCGAIANIKCLCNNNYLCLSCVDDMYDNYHSNNNNNILFICLECNTEIFDYDIIK